MANMTIVALILVYSAGTGAGFYVMKGLYGHHSDLA